MSKIEDKCKQKGVRLTDQRRLIAKAGREKYFKYFNSTLLADFIIKKTFGHKGKSFYWDSK